MRPNTKPWSRKTTIDYKGFKIVHHPKESDIISTPAGTKRVVNYNTIYYYTPERSRSPWSPIPPNFKIERSRDIEITKKEIDRLLNNTDFAKLVNKVESLLSIISDMSVNDKIKLDDTIKAISRRLKTLDTKSDQYKSLSSKLKDLEDKKSGRLENNVLNTFLKWDSKYGFSVEVAGEMFNINNLLDYEWKENNTNKKIPCVLRYRTYRDNNGDLAISKVFLKVDNHNEIKIDGSILKDITESTGGFNVSKINHKEK